MTSSEPTNALTDVVARLEALDIQYMLTGSGAAMFYGLSRSTADLDIVIDLDILDVAPLVDAFDGDYYIDADSVFDALEHRSMFNVIPLFPGLKTDFILLRDEPFQQVAFSRRRRISWHGTLVWVIDPRDLVLSKLNWARDSHSAQQFADVRAIMASGFVEEDDEFRAWVDRLHLHDVLDASRATRYDA